MRVIRLVIYESNNKEHLDKTLVRSVHGTQIHGDLAITARDLRPLDLKNVIATLSQIFQIIDEHEKVIGDTFSSKNNT